VHAVAFAPAVGLTADQLAATAAQPSGADDACWSDRDALLIRLADELYDTDTVTDDLWARLTPHYTDRQLLELIVTAGWYRTIAYVINAARIPLEPWAARFPEPATTTNR
jgi:alkylhydroperoxidase family enzyme